MLLSGFEEENFTNYRWPTMTVGFPACSFKCGRWCQNINLGSSPRIEIPTEMIVRRYLANSITKGIVCAGLEPIDTFGMLMGLLESFRERTSDVAIVYTGYDEFEIPDQTERLRDVGNIIVKYGRYVPNQQGHFDEVLGVSLASDNQYAMRLA